jgi:hypothetical protein
MKLERQSTHVLLMQMGPLTKTPSPALMRRPATSLSTSQSLHWESFADQGITRGICPETALVSPVAIPSGLSAPPITASSFSGFALCQYAVHNLILTLTFPSIACAKQKNDQDDASRCNVSDNNGLPIQSPTKI